MLAFIFPGQGTQRVGMGQHFRSRNPEACELFELAASILGYDIGALCQMGPPDRLRDTRYAQPAIVVCSLAGLRTLAVRNVNPDVVCGHSVGELAALVAAKALTESEALRAVDKRAQLMAASPAAGAMAAILGLDVEAVRGLCARAAEDGVVTIGAINGPLHVVVSGTSAAVERCCRSARSSGAIRVQPLNVSHAFHCSLMESALGEWRQFVCGLEIRTPEVPILSCCLGLAMSDSNQIRQSLIEQFVQPVRWTDCINTLVAMGVQSVVEVGDSKTLCGLARSINPHLATHSLVAPGTAEALAERRDAR